MMISDVAVRRPVLAAVAAIILCVVGVAAFFALPIRELPNVDPPVVSISTNYPAPRPKSSRTASPR